MSATASSPSAIPTHTIQTCRDCPFWDEEQQMMCLNGVRLPKKEGPPPADCPLRSAGLLLKVAP